MRGKGKRRNYGAWSGGPPSMSGQSLLEVALMLPFLLLLALGVVELGRYAYIGILIGNAARAGAAYGAESHITAADGPGIVAAADVDFISNGQNVNNLAVSSAYVCGCDNSGSITAVDCTSGICPTDVPKVVNLSVTASGTFSSLSNYPGIPKSISVSRTATLRVGK